MAEKFLKYFAITILLAVIFTSGLLFYNFKVTKAQNADYDLAGWLWSDNYGWISLSPDNCLLPKCIPGAGGYGVKINSNNKVTGWGWSSNVGWICFGSSCSGKPPGGASAQATLDEDNGQITGWGKVVSLDDLGWISFSGQAASGGVKGEMCYDCLPVCEGWSAYRRCNEEGCQDSQEKCQQGEVGCSNIEPCVVFSDSKYERCNTCFSETLFCNNESDCQQPASAASAVVGGSGRICTDCKNNCRKVFDNLNNNYRIVCDNCSSCRSYGVSSEVLKDFSNGQILGWGWDGIEESGQWVGGAGWIHFNTGKGAFIVFPWLQTLYGSIYTPKEMRQRASSVDSNATYCIFAQDVQRVGSALCQQRVIGDANIDFPGLETDVVYRNALGKVDFTGLTTPVEKDGKLNKYGNEIVIIGENWNGPQDGLLDNKVYYRNGDLKINGSNLVLNNAGAGSERRGNGTIVVNGDLIISNDVIYGGALSNDLKQLASVAWVVRGDVKIDEKVGRLVGAFIILGKGNDCQQAVGSLSEYPKYQPNSCGVFFSGQSSKALNELGLIVAKAFDFQRTFASRKQGSERIIYDGRLVANPPPGLQGFTEGLPVIRDFSN